MLDDQQKRKVINSWRLVVPIAETAADLFYKRLFEIQPTYRSLFPEDMKGQKAKLVKMLSFVVKSLDWNVSQWREDVDPQEDLFLVVLAMGRRHGRLYNIPEESYGPVGEALIWTLEQGLGDAFTDDIKDAWVQVYRLLSKTMIMGTKSSVASGAG